MSRPISVPPATPDSERISLVRLLGLFFKIGSIGFGGGMAVIALMQREFVQKRKLLPAEEFLHGVGLGQNPVGGTPFGGLGIAGLIAGKATSAASFKVDSGGSTGLTGGFQTGGAGSTPYSYFIVVTDTSAGTHTYPMQVLNWSSTGSDSPVVNWPRVAHGTDTITYDVIRMTTPSASGTSYPSVGACGGGSGGTCGSVTTALSQASACTANGGLI